MRKMIERSGVCVVKLKRSDGNGAVANGGHVGVGLDALDEFLLVKPEIAAAARVRTWLQDVARDFGGLLGETHLAGPGNRHINVEQDARRKTFFDDQRNEREHKIRGLRVFKILAAV